MTDKTTATKPENNAAIQLPDLNNMSAKIMQIATRSQKLLATFLERNKTTMGKMPEMDPAHLGQAFMDFTSKILSNPNRFVEAQIAFWQDYVKLMKGALESSTSAGHAMPSIIAPDRSDKRFKDPAWQEAWLFDYIKQSYLLTARWAQNLLDNVDGIDPKVAHKIEFYTHQMIDAISPTNFWMTNPEVLRATIETKGENLVNGLSHLLDDIERGHGQLLIKMSDNTVFKFGENIASSKGKVVYQNELIQLIQFSPLTEKVHKTPILITPPWINKYYILDLKPESSFVRFLVDQGHTVYVISWVNPDGRHAKFGFDDYMMMGPVTAAQEIKKITGENTLNTIGYCIGGTLLSCMLGWLAALGDKKPSEMPEIKSATYLVTLIDFENPGDISVFIDEEQVKHIESMMEKDGYLPASVMGTAFAMLRANDLVWSFVINNYLMGREPFPFDLLSWNSDSTNLPATMQSYYLRNMYMENNLIKPDKLSMKGVPIDLRKITIPTFCLSTVEDHITPWRSTYVATQTYSGPVTFCLSGSGHIAGVVNPPAKKKYGYWTNDTAKCPADPEAWLKSAQKHDGSWWPEWAKWLEQYAGEMVPARDPAKNPNVIEDAPGSYVRVRVM
ncbi:MAG: class I poly(R)-hydroxyalkanoic acid synthase [Alphaproteobacteria bacterium]|nr:class I poly(R)-hydroxyalkanoic acid synthase [Alphaproteobacteria bacterium]